MSQPGSIRTQNGPLPIHFRCLSASSPRPRPFLALVGAVLVIVSIGFDATAGQTPPSREYHIGARDVVDVAVWGQADLTGKFTVRDDGTFAFPLIGDVTAGGRTAGDVEEDIRSRLLKGYLRSPQVSVKVADFRSQRVFVVGAVTRSGAVPLAGRMTLLEALDAAGGATMNAGTEISVLRAASTSADLSGPLLAGQEGVTEVSRVGLVDLQDGRVRENIALQHGDTIVVPKAQEVYILGQVKKPGTIEFTHNMTVFKAISLGGGVTEIGSGKGVRIIRIVDGKKTEIKAKPEDVLKPGDTIVVPTRWF